MNHIDEHTLELFILHAESVEGQRAEIEAHLAECRGCKDLADEIASFHAELKDELAKPHVPAARPEKALTKRNEHLAPFRDLFGTPMPYIPQTRVQKLTRFVFRHPVMSGAGVLSLAAGLALLFNVATKQPAKYEIRDKNPFSYHYDEAGGYLQIFNHNYEKLWEVPYLNRHAELALDEEKNKAPYTKIADIHNDGINEVLTIVPFEGEFQYHNRLRVFSSTQKLLFVKDFIRTVEYDARLYDPFFAAVEFVISNFEGKRTDIFITANNLRSPTFLVRMNNNGVVLGEYWHFGHLMGPRIIQIGPEKKKALLMIGSNDTQDTIKQEYAMIVVIDPEKIMGIKKSTMASMYKLPPSDAELFYIRLPKSSLEAALHVHSGIILQSVTDTLLTIGRSPGITDETLKFHYLFNNDMKVVGVKPTTGTIYSYDQLVLEGKLKGRLDQAYLDNLKNNVEYWDGTKWQKHHTGVNHGMAANSPTPSAK
jgi:hypothetical protein